MNYRKTNLEVLTEKNIDDIIKDHELYAVPRLEKLWLYYEGKNTKILQKTYADEKSSGNPNNKTPIAYGRKIINTYAGYAYKPKYTTYKARTDEFENYYKQLQKAFDKNNEHIKTSINGRNIGIFGSAYELMYVDKSLNAETLKTKAEPRFFPIEPKEVILLYDFEAEPKKKIGIRYYWMDDKNQNVTIYYKTEIVVYQRTKQDNGTWLIVEIERYKNYFGEVPIIPYYFGDDCLGLIEPVIDLIDDYDSLISSSLVEFERFANAYLRLVGMGIGGAKPNDESNGWKWLQKLRKNRIFEQLKDKDDVTFLTKDIPKDFVEFMTKTVHDLIHTMSSVPDFQQFRDISGEAIKRLMFDFENVVSSAEAEFETGLYERIGLMNSIWAQTGDIIADPSEIVITHKRSTPFDLKELAETAKTMKEAGFSSAAVVEIMPDEVIPNAEEELERQAEEQQGMLPDIESVDNPPETNIVPEENNAQIAQ